jgi:hypothetical protein
MEKGKCILCSEDAQIKHINGPRGMIAYDCENCGPYALGGQAHSYLKKSIKDKNDRLKISEWLKGWHEENPDPKRKFKELKMGHLRAILIASEET